MWNVRDVGFPDMGCLGCEMFGMWNVWDVGCSGCRIFGMWDVGGVRYWGCGMLWMWDIRDVGCSGCGMFIGMWDVDLENACVNKDF